MFIIAPLKSSFTDDPHTNISPLVIFDKPTIIFIVVDLPAPLGPRKPNISPGLSSMEMSETIVRLPITFFKFSIFNTPLAITNLLKLVFCFNR